MEYTFDYFVGNLCCPVCGTVSAADYSTDMTTYIRHKHSLAYIGVGDAVDVSPENMDGSNYLTIRPPQPGEDVCILETWECPTCGTAGLWAQIRVHSGMVAEIVAVSLDRATLDASNYIRDLVSGTVSELTGLPPRELRGKDLVSLLRGALPLSQKVA